MRDISVMVRPLELECAAAVLSVGIVNATISCVIDNRTITARAYVREPDQETPVEIAAGSMTFMPGNAHVVCCHGTYVLPRFRRRGLGKAMHRARLNAAGRVGVKAAFCTVRNDNEIQSKILAQAGWISTGAVTDTASGYTKRLLRSEGGTP